ncbi:hypothetical protein A2115_02760 [Candidatus Woesebacteria bacterium GWA1_41_8]|jgi:hypothetical protein|uniref:Uncharacterized protein n=1 Tax=Candidatus Woesebacteria bacterium GWA1_41_8 TaxID=1802471 RepID=A0A1F7WKB5_9BACT|nr:MAG: hypothetical protein A2115_02760 [Candidatus Woesebacteria bacterium GWA1_41_8]
MENGPKGLDKKTLDRLSREWDKRSGSGEFAVRARFDEKGNEIVETFDGMALDPDKNPYDEALLSGFGDRIEAGDMDDDLPIS